MDSSPPRYVIFFVGVCVLFFLPVFFSIFFVRDIYYDTAVLYSVLWKKSSRDREGQSKATKMLVQQYLSCFSAANLALRASAHTQARAQQLKHQG